MAYIHKFVRWLLTETLGLVLGVLWFVALFWCAATKRFDFSEKVIYTSVVALLPICLIAGGAIYERRAKRNNTATAERRDDSKDA